MAITITNTPQLFQPIYNPIVLELDSDKKSEELFQYVVDVNIWGTNQSRFRVQSDPDGRGICKLQKHIEPFVNYSLDHDNTLLFNKILSSYTKYDVTISEEYVVYNYITGTTNSGGTTQYNFNSNHYYSVGDRINVSGATESTYNGIQTVSSIPNQSSIVTSKDYVTGATGVALKADASPTIITATTASTSSLFANNSAVKWVEWPSFDYTDYSLSGGGNFLSSIPSASTVTLGDRIWLNFFNDLPNNSANYLKINSDNGLYHIPNIFVNSTDVQKFISVGVGPWNLLNSASSPTVISGSTPILDSNSTSYTVELIDSSSATTSEVLTFTVNNDCNRFENYRILFLDHLGSFQCVGFDLAHKKSIKVRPNDYKKNYGGYDSGAGKWTYNTYDRGSTRLDTNIEEEYVIRTNFIDENTRDQVLEIIQSPEVYHLDENGNLYAINVLTRRLPEKQRATDKLINYEIRFKYAFNNNAQRG